MAAEEVNITIRLQAVQRVLQPYPCVEYGSDGYLGCLPTGFPVFSVDGIKYVLADGREVLQRLRTGLGRKTGSFIHMHLFHMRGSDDELLKDATYPIVSYDMENGWLVHCNKLWLTDERMMQAEENGYSKEFLDLLRIARDAGFHYAWFDPDADPEPGRPTFTFDIERDDDESTG